VIGRITAPVADPSDVEAFIIPQAVF
jgi:hypothetical protein